ncbi:hypothetical protein D1AOALGA4SA_9883 [Olavius algarvensis Delta 1 endosymbiont]|nr:hypothetical protein D1AOALGA4SA_9883 [Olavius algarvensis Delta 1 endosymbiont]
MLYNAHFIDTVQPGLGKSFVAEYLVPWVRFEIIDDAFCLNYLWFQVSGFRCQEKFDSCGLTLRWLRLKVTICGRKFNSCATPIERVDIRC